MLLVVAVTALLVVTVLAIWGREQPTPLQAQASGERGVFRATPTPLEPAPEAKPEVAIPVQPSGVTADQVEAVDSETNRPEIEEVVVCVLYPDGRPAVGIPVFFGSVGDRDLPQGIRNRQEETDESGRCRFRWVSADADLIAVARGHLPGSIPDFGHWYRDHEGEEVVLRLGDEPLAISGRVLDVEGRPAVGWRVSISDETPIYSYLYAAVEELMRVEEDLRQTGESGEFRLTGLLDREYSLVAWAEEGSSIAFDDSVRAGSADVTLWARADAIRPEVRGRVVGWNGTPVQGATVFTSLRTNWRGGGVGKWAETDETGSFALKSVPRFMAQMDVFGDKVVHRKVVLDSDDPALDMEVAVERWAPIRVDLAPGMPSTLGIIGWGDDREVRYVRRYSEDGRGFSQGSVEVKAGDTGLLWIRESASRLSFYLPDGEPDDPPFIELPIRLDPGAPCNVIGVGF